MTVSRSLRVLHRKEILLVILCVAILLVGYGAWQVGLRISKTTGRAPLPRPGQIITEDTTNPVEKQAATEAYTVPADQPRMIHLTSLSVSGPIQQVGLTKTNAIAVPTNVHFAGWYTNSVKPGYPGLSVIDGHVSGVYSAGIFRRLTNLSKGDTFQVEYGNGERRTFAVVEGKTLPAAEAAAFLLQKRQDIVSQLNLITCDGVYDRRTKQYDKRYVIVARTVSEAVDTER